MNLGTGTLNLYEEMKGKVMMVQKSPHTIANMMARYRMHLTFLGLIIHLKCPGGDESTSECTCTVLCTYRSASMYSTYCTLRY